VIAATALVSLAALCGWCIGLTWHARRTAAWRDPGARLLWTSAIAALVGCCTLVAVVIALLADPWSILALIVVFAVAAPGGWWACELMGAPDPGERRDRTRGIRWELPTRLATCARRARCAAVAVVKPLANRVGGKAGPARDVRADVSTHEPPPPPTHV
jgi:hypothetical protein